MASTYDIDIYKGAPFSLSINATNSSGVPINLEEYSARGCIKYRYGDESPLVRFNVSIQSPESSGILSFWLSATGTASLPTFQGLYELEAYTSGDADVIKFLRGYANIYPEVVT